MAHRAAPDEDAADRAQRESDEAAREATRGEINRALAEATSAREEAVQLKREALQMQEEAKKQAARVHSEVMELQIYLLRTRGAAEARREAEVEAVVGATRAMAGAAPERSEAFVFPPHTLT
jgi:hypothetical protein